MYIIIGYPPGMAELLVRHKYFFNSFHNPLNTIHPYTVDLFSINTVDDNAIISKHTQRSGVWPER